jgi:hypothetical protein
VGRSVATDGVEERVGRRAAFLADDQVKLGRVGLDLRETADGQHGIKVG